MATKKATKPTQSTTSAKTAPRKNATTTKVTTVKASKASTRTAATTTSKTAGFKVDNSTLYIVIAELVGTFILVLIAMITLQNVQSVMPLYLGLALALLIMTVGGISGAHLNPAVTFGLWSARRLKSALLPFYWGAQFLGAMAAVVVTNLVTSNSISLNFSNFTQLNWGIFAIELIGAAVFLFGLTSITRRVDFTGGTKAIGIGLSFFVGLLVATSLFASLQTGIDSSKVGVKVDEKTGQQKLTDVPHELRVKSATLNPAIALATTEQTDTQLQSGTVGKDEKQVSRLSLETLLSTFIGAAIGANLARLMGSRFKA